MVSSDAEQIKSMASAIRDMSSDMKAFNNEMSATLKLVSRMQQQLQSTNKEVRAAEKRNASEERALSKQEHEREQALQEEQKIRHALEKEQERARKEQEKEEAKAAKERKKEQEAQASKRRKLYAIAKTAITGTIAKLISAGARIAKEFNSMQLTANKMGMGSNLSSFYAGTAADMSRAESGKKGFETAVSWVWGKMKLGFDTLVSKLPFVASTVKDIAQLSKQNTIAAAAENLVGYGIKRGQATAIGTNIEIMAAEYIRKYTGRDKDGNLISLADARADERYSKVAAAFTNLVASGGKYDMFNADLATAWGFEQGKWNPNVQYTDAFMADLRSQYLTEAMTKYMSGGSTALADMQNRLAKTQKIISTMAGQLFSFDEVESQQAVSMEDTADATNMYGEDITEKLRNQEELLDKLAKKYGLSYEQVQNIRKILTDTGLSLTDIALLLAAGIRFDDDSTATIIDMATSFGLTAEEIIKAYNMYDNDLSKAAEELRKMAEKGIDVHIYLHDKEGGLQTDSDTTAATGSSHEHETGRGSGSENNYKNLLEEMTDEELKERDPAGWERKHLFESLTDGGTHPAGKEFPSFYDPSGYKQSGNKLKFATGGIGTSKITDATLFENGPEAVIPLTTDIGKQFMADAIQTAIGDTNIGGDTINVKIDGPVFTESERQLNKWATEFGDRYAQIKARRGGK